MALVLCIETATKVCSVAIGKDGKALSLKETREDYSHAEKLTLFIGEALQEAGFEIKQIDAVAVSKGPGSYTGLRIGVSTAKGICYALNKPLISVETLKAMAWGMRKEIKDPEVFLCPMIDARRMEVYAAVFDCELNVIRETQAEIIDEYSYNELLKKKKIKFFGDGAAKCKSVLQNNKNAVFIEDFDPSARFMAAIAEEAYINGGFENVAYFEPYYLKEFLATKPKKLI